MNPIYLCCDDKRFSELPRNSHNVKIDFIYRDFSMHDTFFAYVDKLVLRNSAIQFLISRPLPHYRHLCSDDRSKRLSLLG
jgi:hypothetical protein